MGTSRLSMDFPDLEKALKSAPVERAAAAQWAVGLTKLVHPVISAAKAGGPTEEISELVEQLDDRYFELQELCDEGKCSNEEVLAAFGRARAANAVEYAVRGEAAEAVYEATVCGDDFSGLRRVVAAALE